MPLHTVSLPSGRHLFSVAPTYLRFNHICGFKYCFLSVTSPRVHHKSSTQDGYLRLLQPKEKMKSMLARQLPCRLLKGFSQRATAGFTGS